MLSFEDIIKKETGRESSGGVQSIHYNELFRIYKTTREDELRNTATMLAVIMQDIGENPNDAQDILCRFMAKTWKTINELEAG